MSKMYFKVNYPFHEESVPPAATRVLSIDRLCMSAWFSVGEKNTYTQPFGCKVISNLTNFMPW